MKLIRINMILALALVTFFATHNGFSQQTAFTCQNDGYQFLGKIIGTWRVTTKDRTSPGRYEKNKGTALITNSISGCGIKESYRGTFRKKAYAREVVIAGRDSLEVEMAVLDSEHGSFSILKGSIHENQMVVYWYRNQEKKRLQSKYILNILNSNRFEFSSYLSTDYGKTWALTHGRTYSKIDATP